MSAFGTASYALGSSEYELRSGELAGARRVLQAAIDAMVGGEEGAEHCTGVAGGCRTALLPEPFEELVRRLASSVASGVIAAVRVKGPRSFGGGVKAEAGAGAGFTEWGALLLRKEVRTLQQGLAALMESDLLNTEFGEVNELVREGWQFSNKLSMCLWGERF